MSNTEFLHRQSPDLHHSQEVEAVVDYLRQGGESIPNDPHKKLSAYLGFLATTVNDGILTGDKDSIEYQVDARVITDEDMPESHFELQRRIAREQGRGDITITAEMRDHLTDTVQDDQKAGLEAWATYLTSEDAHFPDWFRFYAWASIAKLGSYDKEKQAFRKRSTNTTAPIADLNREALAYVYDVLNKTYVEGQEVNGGMNDEELQKLITSGNFGKLYAHAILSVTPDSPEAKKVIEGSWTKFEQTNRKKKVLELTSSLQGHGTGWCTAGDSTAAIQLEAGDFYVYYTRDQEGNDTIPRIAVRMQNGRVAEVRGVNAHQELEPEMLDIALEKIEGLPGGDEYMQIAEDMKRLTQLEKIITADPTVELSDDDVIFLYEVKRYIRGFGYDDDPRVDELREIRNSVEDFNRALTMVPEGLSREFNLNGLTSAEGLVIPDGFSGGLDLRGLTSAEGLVIPDGLSGGIDLSGLTSAEGLVIPDGFSGTLYLNKLTSAEGLVLPDGFNGRLDLRGLTSAEGLVLPDGFSGGLRFWMLTSAEGLVIPDGLSGTLHLQGLDSAEGLVLPDGFNGRLDLRNVTNAKGLVLPDGFNGRLDLRSLTSARKLVLPEGFSGEVIYRELSDRKVSKLRKKYPAATFTFTNT